MKSPEHCRTFVVELINGQARLIKADYESLRALGTDLNANKFLYCHNGAYWSWLNSSAIAAIRDPIEGKEEWKRVPFGLIVPGMARA